MATPFRTNISRIVQPVTIEGNPSFQISNTVLSVTGTVDSNITNNNLNVSVTNTPHVIVDSGSLSINNQPIVSVGNLVSTQVLSLPNVTVGAINVPVSVTGTVNTSVTNIPHVIVDNNLTIDSLPSVSINNLPSVQVVSPTGTFDTNITNASLNTVVTNQPTVNIADNQLIGVSGTVSTLIVNPSPLQVTGSVSILNPTQSLSVTGTVDTNILSAPNIYVSGSTGLSVSSLPNVTIASMPDVNINSLPNVTVSSLPSITGSVSVSSGTVSVTGTTNVNITNSSVPVDGVLGVTGSVSISNTPNVLISNPLPVPVSIQSNPSCYILGSVDVSGSTGLQVSSLPSINGQVGVTGSVTVATGSINISNTPNVVIANLLPVSTTISNQPSVTLLDGSVCNINGVVGVTGTVSVSTSESTPLYVYEQERQFLHESVFGALSVAQGYPYMQCSFNYHQALSRHYTLSGSGVSGWTGGMMTLSASTGQSYILTTTRRCPYVNGVGIKCIFAASFSRVSGYIYMGLMNASTSGSGVVLGYPVGSSNFSLFIVNEGSYSATPMSSFNGDALTMTFDATKLNVYMLELQHLGQGTIRASILDTDGRWKLLHRLNVNNTLTTTQTFQLPSLGFMCATQDKSGATISSVGIHYDSPVDLSLLAANQIESVNSGNVTSITTIRPVLSLQAQTTFNSRNWRHRSWLQSISAINTSNQNMIITIRLNPTLTGAAFASHSSTSPIFLDTTSSSFSGTGTQVFAMCLSANSGQQALNLPVIEMYAGDIISVAAQSLNTAGSVCVALTYYNYTVC